MSLAATRPITIRRLAATLAAVAVLAGGCAPAGQRPSQTGLVSSAGRSSATTLRTELTEARAGPGQAAGDGDDAGAPEGRTAGIRARAG